MRPLYRIRAAVVIVFVGLSLAPQLQAEVRLARAFSDHMVLQREKPVRIWGWAGKGDTVTVEFAGQKKSAKADDEGKWMVTLDPMPASAEPGIMTASGATEDQKLEVADVLVGEVWVCSGQSNMAWTVGNCRALLQSWIDAADYPAIRHLRVGRGFEPYPRADLDPSAKWHVCSPKTVGGFTAVGYFFARLIHERTKLPVGLLHSSVGGTRIEPWTPPEGFAAVPELQEVRKQVENAEKVYRQAMAKGLAAVRQWIADTEKALKDGGDLYAPHIPPHPLTRHPRPTMLYSPKIHPLVPYTIRGAIWYQGEANGGEGVPYYHKMRALIGGWRKVWDQGDFPFYYVQLANWRQPSDDPAGGDGWAKIRMAQLKSLAIKNTGMAVAIELADAHNPNDIHPRNKKDVGERLARWALAKDYGQDIGYSGPLYKAVTITGNKAIVTFDCVRGGLMVGTKTGLEPVLAWIFAVTICPLILGDAAAPPRRKHSGSACYSDAIRLVLADCRQPIALQTRG